MVATVWMAQMNLLHQTEVHIKLLQFANCSTSLQRNIYPSLDPVISSSRDTYKGYAQLEII